MKAQVETNPALIGAANILARCLYGKESVEQLSEWLQAEVWKQVYLEARECEARNNPQPGYCFQCGVKVGGNSVECRACHEGEGFQKMRRVL